MDKDSHEWVIVTRCANCGLSKRQVLFLNAATKCVGTGRPWEATALIVEAAEDAAAGCWQCALANGDSAVFSGPNAQRLALNYADFVNNGDWHKHQA